MQYVFVPEPHDEWTHYVSQTYKLKVSKAKQNMYLYLPS